jgi:Sulfotransferase domain
MMMARSDVLTLHEPFSRLADFGEAEIDGRVVRSEPELIAVLRELGERACVFFKDTMDFRYAGALADERFRREATHTFIIRSPDEAIASHFALNPQLKRDEVGFEYLHEMYVAVAEAQGADPVVIDSNDLIERGEATVRAYCQRVCLPFDPAALHWTPGMPAAWKLTERWHVDASETTGFTSRPTRYAATIHDDPLLASYYDYHLPFFDYLYARRLTVAPTNHGEIS